MSFSYLTGTTGASTPVDVVRLLTGDTVESDALLQDEEITYLLTQESPGYAAASAAEAIAAKFARKVSTTVGRLKLDAQVKYDHYKELGQSLRVRAARNTAAPVAPSLSEDAKDQDEMNDDRVVPSFRRDSQEYPDTSNPALGT